MRRRRFRCNGGLSQRVPKCQYSLNFCQATKCGVSSRRHTSRIAQSVQVQNRESENHLTSDDLTCITTSRAVPIPGKMSNDSLETIVKELQKDLVRKYERHHDAVGRYWRSFDANQRARCMKAGAKDAKLLEHPLDRALGNICKFIPEWNLRDITRPGSDALLDLLDHRTSKSLYDQYYDGLNGGKGDANFILDMIHNGGLRLDQTQFPGLDDDCYMQFTDGQDYGTSIRVNPQHRDEVFHGLLQRLKLDISFASQVAYSCSFGNNHYWGLSISSLTTFLQRGRKPGTTKRHPNWTMEHC